MQPPCAPYAKSAADVVKAFDSDPIGGLQPAEIHRRLAAYGENRFVQAAPRAWWRGFAAQFNELVIWILIAAAVLSGFLGDWADTLAILAIVLLNALLGYFQEARAERSLESLKRLTSPMSRTIRGGTLAVVPASEIVPGEILQLEAGDRVPADSRLIESFALTSQESALTGESLPVEKRAGEVLPADTPLADRCNMVFAGTTIAAGKGTAIVTATGMRSELGIIAGLLQQSERESTPLQRRLSELGRVLIAACLAIVALIFVLQWIRQQPLMEILLLAVSLAVAAVPEGLPAVVTVSLALGLQRMVQRNALVRRLPSVETLGSVTVICTDKTGTLTRNEMTVREMLVGTNTFLVSGAGYAPHGTFQRVPETVSIPAGAASPAIAGNVDGDLQLALTIATRCNTAHIAPRGDANDAWDVIGDPTEGALVVAALKHGIRAEESPEQRVFEIPFDSERKMMSVVVKRQDESSVMYSKGAPEVILERCRFERVADRVVPLQDERRRVILQKNDDMAARALRVLALGYRENPGAIDSPDIERDLTFSALVGMIDPPREEVQAAVAKCRRAGIRTVMITGDHPATALAIARELQIADRQHDAALTGRELDQLRDDEFAARVEQTCVYARVSAEHKLRIVEAWQRRGEIVAMTGDGVNDAPAIQAADIGIAMGITGTDVTKEASDLVLTDDNFASIVQAVEEGRGIFDNIQKFIHYLLSCNASEVLVMLFAALIGWPAPLQPIQLLWINLITDGLPALALAMEPPEPQLMLRPPRPPHQTVITWHRGLNILLHGLLMAGVAAIAFGATYRGDPANLDKARATAFCVVAFTQLAFAFGCRSQNLSMPQLGLLTNPALFGAVVVSGGLQLGAVVLPATRSLFDVTHSIQQSWLLIAGLSLLPVSIVEIVKLICINRKSALAGTDRLQTQ